MNKKHKPYPIDHLPPEGLVRLQTVLAVVGIGKTTWYKGMKSGRYPCPIKLMPGKCGSVAWKVDDIRNLINGKRSNHLRIVKN